MSLALKGLQDIKWKVVDLPDIVFFQEGPGVRKNQYTQDGVKLLNVANLQKGKIDLTTSERYISKEEAYGRYEHFLVDEGDLIIASSGIQISYFEEKMGFITEEHLPLCMNTSTIRFKSLDEEVLNIRYFMYFLKTNFFKKQIQRLITGSAQLNFGPSHLKQIKVILPEIAIQDQIVELLDTTQNMIDKRQQQIEALSALKQSVFLDMFGDPNINIKDYKTKKVIELCTRIMGGGTPSKKVPEYYVGNIPWVTPKDMKRKYIDFSTDYINEDAIANSSAKLVPKNSLLMVIRSGILKHTLPVAINTKEVTVNQDMKAFIIDETQITIEYLFYFFKTMERTILSRVRSVTAHNLKFKDLKSMEVPLPDVDSQQEFSRKVFHINERLEKVNEKMMNFELLYNSLLHKSFNGELFKKDIKV